MSDEDGGFKWSNRRERRSRREGEESRMLGVFGEDSDDEGIGGGRRGRGRRTGEEEGTTSDESSSIDSDNGEAVGLRRQRRENRREKLHKPVTFVSRKHGEEEEEGGEEEEEESSSGGVEELDQSPDDAEEPRRGWRRQGPENAEADNTAFTKGAGLGSGWEVKSERQTSRHGGLGLGLEAEAGDEDVEEEQDHHNGLGGTGLGGKEEADVPVWERSTAPSSRVATNTKKEQPPPRAQLKGFRALLSKLVSGDQQTAEEGEPGTEPEGGTGNSNGGTKGVPARALGLGHFEKHTKGFASKYLEKFGFKGRLGKEEQGVLEPIPVQQRPERQGLAYGDFKEVPKPRVTQDLLSPGEEVRRKRPSATKKASHKVRKQFKTAAELLAEDDRLAAGTLGSMPILDMRGPTTRVLSSADQIARAPSPGTVATHKIGKELLHNVNVLADLAEVELHTLHRKIKSAEQQLSRAENEARLLQAEASVQELLAEKADSLHAAVQHAVSAVLVADVMPAQVGPMSLTAQLKHLLDCIVELYSDFPWLATHHLVANAVAACIEIVALKLWRTALQSTQILAYEGNEPVIMEHVTEQSRADDLRRVDESMLALLGCIKAIFVVFSRLPRAAGIAVDLVAEDIQTWETPVDEQALVVAATKGIILPDAEAPLKAFRTLLSARLPNPDWAYCRTHMVDDLELADVSPSGKELAISSATKEARVTGEDRGSEPRCDIATVTHFYTFQKSAQTNWASGSRRSGCETFNA